MDTENLEGQEYYLEPLLKDYLNHCVQVLSVDIEQDEIGSILLVTFNMAFTLILADVLSLTITLILPDLPPSFWLFINDLIFNLFDLRNF